jgi:hypothetical protein
VNRRAAPLTVEIPPPKSDDPAWTKVGVIAAIGFAAGIAWPILTGLQLGPNPPNSGRKKAAVVVPTASVSAGVQNTAPPLAAKLAASAAPVAKNKELVVVKKISVSKCRSKKDQTESNCDTPRAEDTIRSSLESLSHCPSALGLHGETGFLYDIDFKNNRVIVNPDRSERKLPTTTVRGLLACLQKSLKSAKVDGFDHKYSKYTYKVKVEFFRPGTGPDSTSDKEDSTKEDSKENKEDSKENKPESGGEDKVQVSQRQGLVRSKPKTGKVIKRLKRGETVTVLEKKNGWFKVTWAEGETGWIYRKAVGH